jgi:uncharacterized protein YndB with AHSA1/START domain
VPKPVEVTLPSPREIRVVSEYDAPRELIWDCHTKPELVQRWALGPAGWSMPVCRIDSRVGGRYRYVWRNDETGAQFGAAGETLELEAPRLIRHTEVMDGLDGQPMLDEPVIDPAYASVNTMILEEKGGRTILTLTMEFPSEEIRDMVAKTGMTDGMALSYDRIDDIIAAKAAA